MSDRLQAGMRVRYTGPNSLRRGKIAIILSIAGHGPSATAEVRFEEDNMWSCYYLHKLEPLVLTPEQQQYVIDQQRRQAHADRYL